MYSERSPERSPEGKGVEGMPRVTLKDVAARAGVSYQTVSKVLNGGRQVSDETYNRIWQAVRELDYRPNVSARNLRTKASNLIGYPWHYGDGDYYHPILDAFVQSIANAAEAEGFHILTFVDGNLTDPTPYRELYSRNQVGGFILADVNQDDPRVRMLIEQQIPFTAFGRANEDWEHYWVDVDGRAGMRQVVEHLLTQGHERIALITWPEGSRTGQARENGYRLALEEAGQQPATGLLVRGLHAASTGSRAFQQLWRLPAERRPTAIACVSDLIALGALQAARNAGLVVGRDLAITGFDNVELADYTQPPLTSVRQPIAAVGQTAVTMLLAQMRELEYPSKGVLLPPELIIRESSTTGTAGLRVERSQNVVRHES
jgi:DNA-binding LacI/PurR family transcriptional regulator